ncbi:MAG: hypothetical protein LBR99_02390 [Treponema sp.]|jgi:hypothetical protein|nr:hypothetical protein [Treponema sp.]
MRRHYFLILGCFLFITGFVHSQDDGSAVNEYDWATVPPEVQESGKTEAVKNTDEPGDTGGSDILPRSFRRISLGIDLEGLKDILRKDNMFNFREDRDVSLMPSAQEQTLVETQGYSFIRRAFFQLRYGEVFVMAFTLDTTLVDHYSVFSSFVNRYGEPTSLNPQEAVWESEGTRVSIERPLTVKYIDKYNFEMLRLSPAEILVGPSADGARELLRRNEFLDGF